ncbi:hypothetical protein Hanom_Chr01g00035631 [Helianthus anomalus]
MHAYITSTTWEHSAVGPFDFLALYRHAMRPFPFPLQTFLFSFFCFLLPLLGSV